MFPNSTQATHWMFKNEEEIQRIKSETNQRFIEKHQLRAEGQKVDFFLSEEDEVDVEFYFSVKMGEFCTKFQPPMPRYVKGTAHHYFRRFYLRNSVMDHHPKEILVTCVYLACKVEEFNVSMAQFVANIQGNQERATKIILNNELLLMQELQFHLTIHNPFRAVEGMIIDIKTRHSAGAEVDSWRPHIDKFLDSVLLTNAFLIYSPSQIALAAIIHAASVHKVNVDSYVTQQLFEGQPQEAMIHIVTSAQSSSIQFIFLNNETRQLYSKSPGLCSKSPAVPMRLRI